VSESAVLSGRLPQWFTHAFPPGDGGGYSAGHQGGKEPAVPSRKVFFLVAAIASSAITSPAGASDWKYGCTGALPVLDEREAIMFNRDLLMLMPRRWLKGGLRDFVSGSPQDDVIAIAKAANENSGLISTMAFTLLDHPDQKLTLTEKSSQTVSKRRDSAAGPRYAETTIYKKVYRYVSDFGFLDPLDIKMDCMDWQLSAPLR
jgi:hypothetical protein